MSDDFEPPYSTDNYDEIKLRDFRDILAAFSAKRDKKDRARRLEIMKYLAKEAREKKDAKRRTEIADQIGVKEPAALEHCDVLHRIGAIRQTRSRSDKDPNAGPRELIRYYLVAQDLIEILAILSAGMLGLDREAAKRIKDTLTKEFNANPNKFKDGLYASGLYYLQAPAFDALRNIAHHYIQIQRDLVNSWPALAEVFNAGYYYPWFYPAANFANMASKAYRSIADYAISVLNMAQNNFDAFLDVSKTYSELVDNNTNELSRMALNYSKSFKPMLGASISTEGEVETTTTITSKPPDSEDDEEYDLSELRKLIEELTEIQRIALSSA